MSAGNGKRLGTIKAPSIEKTTPGIVSEALAELLSCAGTPPVHIKIEKLQLTIEVQEHHEHKYFIGSPQSLKTIQYTALAALGEFPDVPSDAPDEEMRRWRREVDEFDRMKDDLLNDAKLRNKFVAVHNGRVVDYDENKFELAKRVRRAFPGEVVLIERVQCAMRVIDMPSPELG